jgi:hypothetical protein
MLWKLLFPCIWIPGFGAGTIAMWQASTSGLDHWMFTVIWIVGSFLTLLFAAKLKHVRVDGDQLFIKGYFLEISMPLSNIKDVHEIRWFNPRTGTLRLRRASEFGDKIYFIADLEPFTKQTALDWLNALARERQR